MPRPPLLRTTAYASFALALVVVVVLALRAEGRAVVAELAHERDLHGTEHAGSAACARCHAEHAASWHKTFHRTMTQDIGLRRPDAVVGVATASASRTTSRRF